ncbi:MAG: hypothetical protein RIQ89_1349 [Bacteroidota bacterium]|jgi:hypothetical protein
MMGAVAQEVKGCINNKVGEEFNKPICQGPV